MKHLPHGVAAFCFLLAGALAYYVYDRQAQLGLAVRANTQLKIERDRGMRKISELERQLRELQEAQQANLVMQDEVRWVDAAANAAARYEGASTLASNRFRQLVFSPELKEPMAIQQRALLDVSYRALFAELKLPDPELAKLKALLIARHNAFLHVTESTDRRSQPGRAQLLTQALAFQKAQDALIQSTLGDAAYRQYLAYQLTLPQRYLVELLERRLSYGAHPLGAQQAADLLALLAQQSPREGGTAYPPRIAGTTYSPFFAGVGGALNSLAMRSPILTPDILQQARRFLGAEQSAALAEIAEEQAADTTLGNILRDHPGRPPRPSAPTPASTTES